MLDYVLSPQVYLLETAKRCPPPSGFDLTIVSQMHGGVAGKSESDQLLLQLKIYELYEKTIMC